jgi:hypothetical protein
LVRTDLTAAAQMGRLIQAEERYQTIINLFRYLEQFEGETLVKVRALLVQASARAAVRRRASSPPRSSRHTRTWRC